MGIDNTCKRIGTLLLSAVAVFSVWAETNTTFLEGLIRPATWNRPLWADIYPNLIRFDVASATNSANYDFAHTGRANRSFLFGHIGADIPLWSGGFNNGQYALSVTTPFSIGLWMDASEGTTSPVINTDYRIGLPEVTFLHRLQEPIWGIKNYSVRFAPIKHESTHIGDEIALWRANEKLPLRRVNVSYNYTELAVTLNDSDGSKAQNHSVRLGLMMLINWNRGWYFVLPSDGDISNIVSTESKYEFYAQYQYQTTTFKKGFQGIGSIEFRNRVKYDYETYERTENGTWYAEKSPSGRQWCINAFVGMRYSTPNYDGYFSKIGLGVRAYYGVNPYGQFRAHNHYNQIGLSIIFE